MRRLLAAIIGTAAGTTLLVGLKAGPLTGKSATSAASAASPSAPSPSAPSPAALLASAAPPPVATGPTTASHGPTTASHGPTSTPPTGSARPGAAATTATFTGSVVQTEYGPVQVRIVVSGGRITDVTAIKLPDHAARSVQISGRAAPILRQETLSAQNATINTVSGATYTSEGYRTSLQAALDAAKRG
ncbi:MAG: FMN-binding protein [Dactylosporangium sp.]|nr:FMN-binding protein [Dactylosporangium sp.]